ncbi:MAG: sigma-70 family RNA polymerase sigma factor, partial [Isosphaeraceae bacterium]
MPSARETVAGHRRQIGTLFAEGALGQVADRQLLDRFLRDPGSPGSEAAFELVVRRHAAMVRRVCQMTLGEAADVDDAVQATFLVLARRAAAIRDREAVASWLYGVAFRTAARARVARAKRTSLERQVAIQRARVGATSDVPESQSILPELLEEVERLPVRYRNPIVLCYLEGQSHQQAAETLGCPLRTLQTRLLRAKAKLRTRLVRRGLAPTAILLALEGLAEDAAAGGLTSPVGLIENTTRAAIAFAASRAVPLIPSVQGPSSLALGVLGFMARNEWKRSLGLVTGLMVGLAVAAVVLAASGPDRPPPATITGTVRDPSGKPIAGAEVWLPVRFTLQN